MANPIEKDEDQSIEKRTGQLLFSVASFTLKIGKDITEWFEKAFENIKGAFDKHECFVEKTIWGWKVKVGETCQFFEECVKETGCELKWWASMIKGILIVILVYFLLIVVYFGFYLEVY